MAQFGITTTGFVVKQQSDIILEIQTALQQALGSNINLLPEAVFGQLVGVFSEREALQWQLAEAVYNSGYPSGAEGVSVDNILALNNLRRLPAKATVTAPTNTSGTPGLVLLGTPGTIIPAGSIISVSGNPTLQFTLDADVTIAAAVNAVQLISFYGGAPSTGSFSLQIVDTAGNTLTTPLIPYNALAALSQLSWPTGPTTSGTYKITLTSAGVALATGFLNFNDNAATVTTAIQALAGYSGVVVSGSYTAGFSFNWGSISQPLVTLTSNTLDKPEQVIDSVQSTVNNLHDTAAANYPYSDVTVSGAIATALLTVTFGAGTAAAGQPVSSAKAQQTLTVPANSLQNGTIVININAVTSVGGSPAEGIGSATCTVTGPNYVPAGFLTVIGSPISGWASVTNPLDAITGSVVETDIEALTRRVTLLAAQANGPLQAIVEKVDKVSGVKQAIGFENTSLAAEQMVTFNATPSGGSFTLSFTGPSGTLQATGAIAWNALANIQQVNFTGVPSSGSFTLAFGAQVTASIPFNATFSSVQSAIRALTGYEGTVVTGSFAAGFRLAFGFNSQLPVSINSTTLDVTPSVVVSVQSRINELTSYSEALVSGSFGAGFLIAFNGSAGGQPQLLAVAANSLTGVTVLTVAFGRPGKSFEIVVNDNNGQAENNAVATAIYGAKPAGMRSYGNIHTSVTDAFGNPFPVEFSRPTQVPVYMIVTLLTDLTSSANPKFNPSSIQDIQANLVAIGSGFPIGGLIVGFGSAGLIGAFNDVPGIVSYTLYFGTSPNPAANDNIQLLPQQVALFETFNIIVSYN